MLFTYRGSIHLNQSEYFLELLLFTKNQFILNRNLQFLWGSSAKLRRYVPLQQVTNYKRNTKKKDKMLYSSANGSYFKPKFL